MERNSTLVGGLGGAAILAMLMGNLSRPKTIAPLLAPRASAAVQQTVKTSQNPLPGMDTSGPWAAICQEYWKAPEVEPEPVEWKSDPDDNVGASEITIHKSRTEGGKSETTDEKLSVLTYPGSVDFGKCKLDGKRATIIATVPDPVSTHLQLDFDRAIVAIERAAGFMGYDFQRYWLPWSDPTATDEDARKPLDDDKTRLRLLEPGVLVFRASQKGSRQEDSRLFVFVVGETPTGGLDRKQFEKALQYAQQLDSATTLDIAGPQFSSSLRSLSDLLSIDPAQASGSGKTAFRVYSPSVTSDTLIRDFGNSLTGKVDFFTFEIGYAEAEKRFCETMETLGYRPEELGVLVEDESAFGGDVARSGEPDQQPDCKSLLTLQFPRDLSAIRNADGTGTAALSGGQPVAPELGVPLSLREKALTEHDSPPAYATEQSAAVLDRELQSIVRNLRANHTQAVMLAVSNPLDRVYLFDYLHRAMPDVRLATVDSDVLMLGRPRYVDLRGTIGITALPVVSTAQVRNGKRQADVEFGSSPQAGMFLSVVTLIAQQRPPEPCPFVTLVGKTGIFPAYERTCSPSTGPEQPQMRVAMPLIPWSWTALTAILGFVVLIFIAACRYSTFLSPGPEQMTWFERLFTTRTLMVRSASNRIEKLLVLFIISNQFLLVEWMIVTASCTAAWGVIRDRLLSNPDSPLLLGVFPRGILGLAQTLMLLLHPVLLYYSAKLSWDLGRLAWNTWTGRANKRNRNALVFSFILIGSALYRLWILIPALLYWSVTPSSRQELAIRTAREERPFEKKEWKRYFYVTGISSLVYLAWILILWWRILAPHWWPPDFSVALRSINVLEGLSPLAMMACVLLAYAWWGYIQLNRITMMEDRGIVLDFGTDLNHQGKDFKKLQEELHREIDYARYQQPRNLKPALVALFCCFLLHLNLALRGIDGPGLPLLGRRWFGLNDWSLFFGVGMLVFLLAISFQQMWSIWRRLSAILNLLEVSRLCEVFRKLPSELSSMRIWKIGTSEYSFSIQERTLCELRALAPKRLDEIENAESLLHQVTERSTILNDEDIHDIRQAMNMALPFAVDDLKPAREDEKPSITPFAFYASLRFLALIQYALLQIRNMMFFQAFAFLFLLLCISVYPFQGRQSLTLLLTLVFLGLLGVFGLLFTQMDGNPILRRVEASPDGTELPRISYLGVLRKIFAVAGVPLIAVLASQFPALADFFGSWLSPVSEALK